MDVSWLNRLIQWIKRLFRRKTVAPKPTIEAEWTTWYGTLYRLRRSTPEAVDHATYRFVPAYQEGHFLLTCDRYRRAGTNRGSGSSAGHTGIRNGSPTPGHPNPSHRLSLTHLQARGNLVKAKLLFSYPVDFVGSQTHARIWQASQGRILTKEFVQEINNYLDKSAILITAELAELLLLKYIEQINWEQEIHERAARLGSSHLILLGRAARH